MFYVSPSQVTFFFSDSGSQTALIRQSQRETHFTLGLSTQARNGPKAETNVSLLLFVDCVIKKEKHPTSLITHVPHADEQA